MDVVTPPPQIAWFVSAVGETAALSFIETVGGRRIWVPRNWRGSEMSRLYGDEIAAALSEEMGGNHWDVPVCREWRVLLLYCQGLVTNDIAFRVGLSRSRVVRILQWRTPRIVATRETARADTRQMMLFG